MKNKRGISPVVASLLLVVLTILAVVMVGSFVKNFLKNKMGETNCIDYMDYVKIGNDIKYNCYNETNTKVQIERGFKNLSIDGIYVVVTNDDSKSYTLKDGVVSGVNNDNSIKIPRPGEVKVYLFDKSGEKVKVGVIVNGEICSQVMQTYSLSRCI